MNLVCISDTHNRHNDLELPEGDILVHTGDCTLKGSLDELIEFNNWLGSISHKYRKVIIIAGNHDKLFLKNNALARLTITNATYLENSEVIVDGIRFYGAPTVPGPKNWAFGEPYSLKREMFWDRIPNNTDVLLTHGPPHKVMDYLCDFYARAGEDRNVGCKRLAKRVSSLNLKAHIFGHIHEGHGMMEIRGTKFVNASIMDPMYEKLNKPIIIDI